MFTNLTSLVIPTRNRSQQIIYLLNQIIKYNIQFNQIIIVDSSNKENKTKIQDFIKNKNIILLSSVASTTKQRNIGLKKTKKNSKFILFFDDDLKIKKNTFHNMNAALKKYSDNKKICSYGFNLVTNQKKKNIDKFKESKLLEFIGLYNSNPGKVLTSGWHTRISDLKEDTYVEWIYTGAVIFVKEKIINRKFSNLNKGYNYLEDLHFSYALTKKNYQHIIISKAKVCNFNFVERNDYKFGKIEIENRYKFVNRYKKKKCNFYFTAIIRAIYLIKNIFNFKLSWVMRFSGNIVALYECITKDLYNQNYK